MADGVTVGRGDEMFSEWIYGVWAGMVVAATAVAYYFILRRYDVANCADCGYAFVKEAQKVCRPCMSKRIAASVGGPVEKSEREETPEGS